MRLTCNMNFMIRMPYTQAVILEAHRHGKTLPQFIPHKVEKDFYYKDYLIKKVGWKLNDQIIPKIY